MSIASTMKDVDDMMGVKGKQDFDGTIDGVGYKRSMDDPSKPPMSLVPPELSVEVAKVLGFGAKKYARGQWMRGMSFSEVADALERHLRAWQAGEDTDPDSGLPHLAHIGCCTAFLLHFTQGPRAKEYARFDDRLFRRPEPNVAFLSPLQVPHAGTCAFFTSHGHLCTCGAVR